MAHVSYAHLKLMAMIKGLIVKVKQVTVEEKKKMT